MDIEIEEVEKTENSPAPADLKSVIADSKKTLAKDQQAKVQKKRGPKPKPKPAAPPPEASTSPAGEIPAAEMPVSAAVPAPALAPILKNPIKYVSKFPAMKYQIPELQFTDDEAMATAEALDQVVQAFVPDLSKMDPKTASVMGAISVVGSIGFQKFLIYRSTMAARATEKKPEATATEAATPETQPAPADALAEMFPTQAVP